MGAIDFFFPFFSMPTCRHLDLGFDERYGALWIGMHKADPQRPLNMSLDLLNEMRSLLDGVKAGGGYWHHDGDMVPLHYVVVRSHDPLYYNQGGDLAYFRECIRRKDWESLRAYSLLCADLMFEAATAASGSVTSVALVQGRALGGGFENALNADHLIAEAHSTFSFPEISFGLFPCSGAMSLLARRIGPWRAERMMTNPRVFGATELFDMGVIDEICPSGQGEQQVRRFIAQHSRQRAARQMVQRSRQRLAPPDRDELYRICEEWTELAKALTPQQLRVMDMLVMLQSRAESSESAEATEATESTEAPNSAEPVATAVSLEGAGAQADGELAHGRDAGLDATGQMRAPHIALSA